MERKPTHGVHLRVHLLVGAAGGAHDVAGALKTQQLVNFLIGQTCHDETAQNHDVVVPEIYGIFAPILARHQFFTAGLEAVFLQYLCHGFAHHFGVAGEGAVQNDRLMFDHVKTSYYNYSLLYHTRILCWMQDEGGGKCVKSA